MFAAQYDKKQMSIELLFARETSSSHGKYVSGMQEIKHLRCLLSGKSNIR